MNNMSYGILKKALDTASLRQETISSNIANVNTPGYKVNKVAFESHLKQALDGTGLVRTDDGHMHIGGSDTLDPTVHKRTNTSVKDNGNNVDVDYEMAELAANNIYYDAVVSQLNAKYAMMRTVLK
ncbi:flagellar basal body rod protein FlgB [Atopococcus tabaci]|uniref:flagellar basal body rod protein FlgB n=1 Tax=Atopococcus tabaci TaxID=269774 RepID=UPI0003F97762|nr:flagellar basal body rod protein FlgB [Atopococcus tabaci]